MSGNSLIEIVNALDHRGVHNFSISSLHAYFHLQQKISKGDAHIICPGTLHVSGNHAKTWIFTEPALRYKKEILALRDDGPVYSIDKQEWLGKDARSFEEIAYHLPTVFDPAQYQNAKKRHQRLVYPFKWLDREKIKIIPLAKELLPEIAVLHDDWVSHNIDVKKVFKMMFPTGRYLSCVKQALESEIAPKKGLNIVKGSDVPAFTFVSWVAMKGQSVLAVRVAGKQKNHCFDLAYFSRYWDMPSQLTNYLNTKILHDAFQKGVEWWNCGAEVNKGLRDFKSHYPHIQVKSYVYGRLK
jgi:hypothetical protein